ncbi:hypothetical protein EYZ11_007735 [Aspergillus tanneri]|uniref:Cytochrome P450 n=1 Tax=Aspergillus tanneri TaxID=1220188 RepID=A0A4V3UNW5_9EURO|nr:hypothetical protein EYZ11_007735 [Aspergillus tanneri]
MEAEPMVQEKVGKLLNHFETAYQTQSILGLNRVFQAFTAEVATHHFYGSSFDMLGNEQFSRAIQDSIDAITRTSPFNKLFPTIGALLRFIPPWILVRLRPAMSGIVRLQETYTTKTRNALAARNESEFASNDSRDTPFTVLINPKLPQEERSLHRLLDEQMAILGAGSESTTNTLTVAMFHLLNNGAIYLKLRRELEGIMPTPTSIARLSQTQHLPYLVCVILAVMATYDWFANISPDVTDSRYQRILETLLCRIQSISESSTHRVFGL